MRMKVIGKDTDLFWSGFDTAIQIVKDMLENCERISLDQWAHIMDNINIEVEKYKNG